MDHNKEKEMSFIEKAMEVGPELVAPDGTYDLEIVSAEVVRTKADDRDMIRVGIRIEAPEDYRLLNEYLVIPNDGDWDEENGRKAKMFVRHIKRFLQAFDMSIEDVFEGDVPDAEVLKGCKGRSPLVQEDYEGEAQNKLRLPRLRQ